MLKKGSKARYLGETTWAYENGKIYEVVGYSEELDAWGVKSEYEDAYMVAEENLEEVSEESDKGEKTMAIQAGITFDEAFKIASERKAKIDNYTEYDNAYVFSFTGDDGYIGGLGHTPVVVMKEDGRITTMPEFVYSGAGKLIRESVRI